MADPTATRTCLALSVPQSNHAYIEVAGYKRLKPINHSIKENHSFATSRSITGRLRLLFPVTANNILQSSFHGPSRGVASTKFHVAKTGC